MLSSRIYQIAMKMNKKINELAAGCQERAREVLEKSGIARIWQDAGCRVNLVGSLRMGLLASHRDIDLHVYSKNITVESSFAIAAKIAADKNVMEIRCINGLHTDEHCVAWHFFYDYKGEKWQFDVIHIEECTYYDGFFERMADRIVEVMTDEQRETILRLKFDTPKGREYHGVEYYEAVIADGVATIEELDKWVAEHRNKPQYYWFP